MQVVLALKGLGQAKSRLRGVLDDSQRRSLVVAMARDVIGLVTGFSGVQHTTVVAGDGWCDHLSEERALSVVREADLGVAGLNPALEAIVSKLGLQPGLILHGDLPYLAQHELAELHDRALNGETVVCPDKYDKGTNAIAVQKLATSRFAFGDDSFAAHLKMAMAWGHSWRVLRRPGLLRDVDSPADLGALLHDAALGNHLGAHTLAWARDHGATAMATAGTGTAVARS